MGETTEIAWASGTFNPWWGCARVSEACKSCYAESLSKRFGFDVWGKTAERRTFGDKHWNEPILWNAKAEKAGIPKLVFCASMADVFEDHPELPTQRERLWGVVERTPWLTWELLTKRPENIMRMVPESWHTNWPVNVWAGTTIETQRWADERLPHLLSVPAPVLFVSCEPLLGPLDLGMPVDHRGHGRDFITTDVYPQCLDCSTDNLTVDWTYPDGPQIGWVISGGESGHSARPSHPDWFRSLRDQCQAAKVPYLHKQWGEWAPAPWRVDREHEAEGATHGIRSDTGYFHQLGHASWSLERNDTAPVFGELVWAGMLKVGKKTAGRELDGKVWNEIPERHVPH